MEKSSNSEKVSNTVNNVAEKQAGSSVAKIVGSSLGGQGLGQAFGSAAGIIGGAFQASDLGTSDTFTNVNPNPAPLYSEPPKPSTLDSSGSVISNIPSFSDSSTTSYTGPTISAPGPFSSSSFTSGPSFPTNFGPSS